MSSRAGSRVSADQDQSLIAWRAVLAGLEPALAPVAPAVTPIAEAVGAVLAAPLRLAAPEPSRATALRPGFAVRAADLVGAGPYAPLPLLRPPVAVAAGEALPADADAVAEAHVFDRAGRTWQAVAEVEPGAGVWPAGGDGATGEDLAGAGTPVTPLVAAAARALGIEAATVRRARVRLGPAGRDGEGARDWLATALRARGATLVADGGADLTLDFATAAEALPAAPLARRVAFAPGDLLAVSVDDRAGRPLLVLPARLVHVVALFHAAIGPCLDRLTARAPDPTETRRLAHKVTGVPGHATVVWLDRAGEDWVPLGCGELPAARLARVRAIAVLEPGVEGWPEGAMLEARPVWPM